MRPPFDKDSDGKLIGLFLQAFAECGREMQEIVVEMAAILADEDSTDDDRAAAYDAMVEALFPGTTAEARQNDRARLRSPEAVEAANALKDEESLFADRIRQTMKSKEITQEQLAEKAGVSQPAISNILNRQCRPQRKTIERLSAALDVAPAVLWPSFGN